MEQPIPRARRPKKSRARGGASINSMNTRISTGTGLALLAGAIVFHAFASSGAGSAEAVASPAWTPVFVPVAAEPQSTPAAAGKAAQAPTADPQVLSIAAVPTPSSGSGTVVFRLWSNGNVDRRLVNSTTGLSYQNGWQPLVTTP
jgi:hypothetical protein